MPKKRLKCECTFPEGPLREIVRMLHAANVEREGLLECSPTKPFVVIMMCEQVCKWLLSR